MGVFVDRDQEPDLYRETYEEAQRLIRVSEEVRLAAEKVDSPKDEGREPAAAPAEENGFDKLTTSKLAKALGLKTAELGDKLIHAGLVERDGDELKLTAKGKATGGEFRSSGKFGPYFLWPADIHL
ncbi:hypothetical protein [uncultured Thiodictyon sp.]|uniref:hypothetical protein n=1 Tax=uncultured Thiodictyon sp. TaxID=1846217 RepID=UPI0025F7D577|nr:hypothetical protein [uncultured Thiodictyon sp.]